jgi:ABC-type dipeptide/oligopeptide/nickel transport system permease component
VSRSQKWFIRPALFAFVVGAFIPLFWGVMVFLLFSVPEGWFSRFFWHAVYITCPFWVIEGEKALVLMPMLNGLMYTVLTLATLKIFRLSTAANRNSH